MQSRSKNNVLIIQTDRTGLILRELATDADDVVYFEAAQEDPDHVDNYGNEVASKYDTLEKVRDRRLNAGDDVRTGIWDGDEFKGSISARFEENIVGVEVGYWLRKSATGNGYATLAVKALTGYLMPRVPRVFAEVNVKNEPSIKVMERAGYHQVEVVDRDWGRAIVFEPAT